MPQASDEQRRQWGDNGGVGEQKAIAHLEGRGFVLTRQWTWIKPTPDYQLDNDDWGAVGFLIDEWDWGGLAD